MSTDDRNVLEILQAELEFIKQGGYGRSVRTPWRVRSTFRDSPICINYACPEQEHPCNECHLIDFVPEDKRSEQVPCHFIPLNDRQQTVDELEAADGQWQLEQALRCWLETKIRELEQMRQASTEG
jgi:hypothetical protein